MFFCLCFALFLCVCLDEDIMVGLSHNNVWGLPISKGIVFFLKGYIIYHSIQVKNRFGNLFFGSWSMRKDLFPPEIDHICQKKIQEKLEYNERHQEEGVKG